MTWLVSSGVSVREELLETWRRQLDQYARLHSQEVRDNIFVY